MIHVVTDLFVRGETFSPARAEAALGIVFSEKGEKGSPMRGGRTTTFGFGILSSAERNDPVSVGCELNEFVRKVRPLIEGLRELGCEHIELSQTIHHDSQCNIEFSREEIDAIQSLGLGLSVSCYRDDALIRRVEEAQMKAGAKSQTESRSK